MTVVGWGLALVSAQAAPPDGPEPLWLEFVVSLTGKGSAADFFETLNYSQSWTYTRLVAGYLELVPSTQVVGEGADRREITTFVPKVDGKVLVSGRLNDAATCSGRSYGEGLSWSDYRAQETWSKTMAFPGRYKGGLGDIRFVLDSKDHVWRVTIQTGVWLDRLKAEVPEYSGSASTQYRAPGSSGPSECDWEHYATCQEDRQVEWDDAPCGEGVKSISAGLNPGGFESELYAPAFEFTKPHLTNSPTLFSGQFSTNLPAPGSGSGGVVVLYDEWKMQLDFAWTLREKLPELELVLEAEKNQAYLSWEPQVSPPAGDMFGAIEFPLHLAARLRSPSGEDLSRVKVEKFVWRLTGTSHEPGLAMNFPTIAPDSTPDLTLYAEKGTYLDKGEQALEIQKPESLISRAEVIAED